MSELTIEQLMNDPLWNELTKYPVRFDHCDPEQYEFIKSIWDIDPYVFEKLGGDQDNPGWWGHNHDTGYDIRHDKSIWRIDPYYRSYWRRRNRQ